MIMYIVEYDTLGNVIKLCYYTVSVHLIVVLGLVQSHVSAQSCYVC